MKQVLETHGAIVPHRTGNALVVTAQTQRVTTPAAVAVEKIFSSANSADSTALAVKLTLAQVVVEKFAHAAKVGSKHVATTVAGLLHGLRLVATHADDLTDSEAV